MPESIPGRYEAGSYNLYAIAGLNAGIKWINEQGIENIYKHKKELTDYLVDELLQNDEIELYIPEDRNKHIGVLAFNVAGYISDEVGKILSDEYDISVRTGHHCAPLIGEFLGGEALNGTVRISMGIFNIKSDLNEAIEEINNL